MAEEIDVLIRQKTGGKKRLRDSFHAMMSWAEKSGRAFRLVEDEIPATVIDRLIALGHVRASPPGILRSSMGGGQAIMIDPVNGTLMSGSDPRKNGLAIGY